ncbi:MAG: hypothetical protein JW779_13745 [Candidatus Thorarchaeota archaeon]|nr:hypothetical protein [Candidatus Thorarchaeota archaeon]
MIDDDFESVFRRIFESFMNSFGNFPEGSTSISSWSGSMSTEPEVVQPEDRIREVQAERIDLDDNVLLLLEVTGEDGEAIARVEGRNLIVVEGIGGKETTFELDFDIDIKNSNISHRNGIVEISLKKVKDGKKVETEGYLHSE